ncbi:MAG TPA: hypothetical protein VE093_17550 [Polyangiaceae bacterium]|nr:hypothetical protein [Polyangiaceae bacterium]
MAHIVFGRFKRLLTRCQEVASEPAMNAGVVAVHTSVVKPAADAFLKAHDAVVQGETDLAEQGSEAAVALREMDPLYRVARSVLLAFKPGAVLPITLRSQPTDTDKMNAIEDLLKALNKHAGEAWADAQLQGAFGVSGAKAVTSMKEAIAANKALSKAREDRASAYDPAYDGYLAFKRVVRDALGSKSKQYKRIHLRDTGADADADAGTDAGENASGEAPRVAPKPPAEAQAAMGASA